MGLPRIGSGSSWDWRMKGRGKECVRLWTEGRSAAVVMVSGDGERQMVTMTLKVLSIARKCDGGGEIRDGRGEKYREGYEGCATLEELEPLPSKGYS
ncbi:hypothetical protein SLEP1_g18989 [Rubroshorea leprosula]|uniref:Uncharacterized protein n=1 Tax=Rubroshorea leprosula TaxID=152421 RepID=A0AAV5J8I7_9ROSI|nr:hypothetical protein SLEP1_g18989 [Rubroshorea leprosula]